MDYEKVIRSTIEQVRTLIAELKETLQTLDYDDILIESNETYIKVQMSNLGFIKYDAIFNL